MILPVQITFRHVNPSEEAEADIRNRARKLETYYSPITSCRVLVEAPARQHERGYRYHVRIDLTIPGDEIVVRRAPTLYPRQRDVGRERTRKKMETHPERKHLKVAIREAFEAARRRLQDHARRKRVEVKTHEPAPEGLVTKIFPAAGYGYLETAGGDEVYFHRNSVLGNGFEKLKLGTRVTFVEEDGEKGPQASTVKPLARSRPVRPLPPAEKKVRSA